MLPRVVVQASVCCTIIIIIIIDKHIQTTYYYFDNHIYMVRNSKTNVNIPYSKLLIITMHRTAHSSGMSESRAKHLLCTNHRKKSILWFTQTTQ